MVIEVIAQLTWVSILTLALGAIGVVSAFGTLIAAFAFLLPFIT